MLPRPAQRGKKDRNQNRNDSDHDQQFNQRESASELFY
jgi:hypothetical protein